MKTYKLIQKQVVDKVICDVCGKVCTDDRYGTEYGTLEALWGYNSRSDGSEYEIHLCENCFYDTIRFMREKRSEYTSETPKYDPFFGKKYPII